ncbi:MAG: 3-phosphoserine/phosphohydroxythreonine transaminase, partial [Clostridia bacterium]|nr:3-phosphoserine/phosphohydroxythreonine transaminase [Clostridia bacterium]
MKKIYNFSAGPATLPKEVLDRAAAELTSYGDTGISVMEMNHRSPEFLQIMERAESALRRLMHVPDNYKILFMQGGATMQFSAIPLNLFSERRCADYVVSGQFSKSAYIEAKKYGDVVIAASSAGASPVFSTVPQTKKSDFRPDADYVHICFNNTIYGTKFNYVPDTGNIPLVADMSSCILSEPTDVSKFALIYASAQKNIAPAGLTVVIIRDDLLGK